MRNRKFQKHRKHWIHHSPMKRQRYQMHQKQVTARISGCRFCFWQSQQEVWQDFISAEKGKANKETIGYDWELLCEAPFFIQKNHRKEQKTMMKAMEKRQEARKNQEKTLKRMMAYQKKAEQMVSRKRVNHHMIRKG